MTTNQLLVPIVLIVTSLMIPLIVMVVVRFAVKDEVMALANVEVAAPEAKFDTIGDFWTGMAPHLFELRDRLVKSVLALGIGTAIGFYLVNSTNLLGMALPDFMVKHLAPPGTTLQAVQVGETFFAYMRIALVVGTAMAMPVIVYQIVAFFSPGLLPNEKRIVYTALPFVSELFLAGLLFGWSFTVPAALAFLLNYGTSEMVANKPTIESFMGLVATLLLWNGLIFELPAIVFLLARLGIVTTKQLAATRRYAIVIITIIAALITPTGDPYNLLLLAGPMYLLYELGILLSRFVPKKPEEPTIALPTS